MDKKEKIRKWIVDHCVRNIRKDICQHIFFKLATDKEIENIKSSVKIIETQRKFNASINNIKENL